MQSRTPAGGWMAGGGEQMYREPGAGEPVPGVGAGSVVGDPVPVVHPAHRVDPVPPLVRHGAVPVGVDGVARHLLPTLRLAPPVHPAAGEK